MQLNTFSFTDYSIRVVFDEEGNPLWVAKDIAEALGYSETTISNMAKTIEHVPEEWKGRYRIPTLGGDQDALVLNEQGLYFFLNRSDKSGALPFQKWIAGEVLPSIRKTGQYAIAKVPQSLSEALRLAADLEDQRQTLAFQVELQASTIKVLEPKAKGLDRIAEESEGALCMTDAAKVLQVSPYWFIGRLCQRKWIYQRAGKSDWVAYQDKIQSGYLEHKVAKIPSLDGQFRTKAQVMITKKGLARVAHLLSIKMDSN
jgi:anti-repressor protein